MAEWEEAQRRGLVSTLVLGLCTKEHPRSLAFTEVVEALKGSADEREVQAALMRHVQSGALELSLDFKLSVPETVLLALRSRESKPSAEAELRALLVDPQDLDRDPFGALMDALYMKYGAGAEAYDFTEYCKSHERWFEVAASAWLARRSRSGE